MIINNIRKTHKQRLEIAQKDSDSRAWNQIRVLSKDNACLRIRPDGTYDMYNEDPDQIMLANRKRK